MSNNNKDLIDNLLKYKKLYEEQYRITKELDDFRLSNELRGELEGKYFISPKEYGFSVMPKIVKPVPLDELKRIEELTGASLYEVANFKYAFSW